MYIIFLYTEKKNATVKLTEMADSDSTGSKEKQDVDIFVDNHLLKIPNMQESEKNIAVELADMVSIGAVLTTGGKCVFGGRTGYSLMVKNTGPNCHLVLQWEEGGG